MLWTAISAMQRDDKDAVFVVYTGDVGTDKGKGQVSKEDILEKVKVRGRFLLVRPTQGSGRRREAPRGRKRDPFRMPPPFVTDPPDLPFPSHRPASTSPSPPPPSTSSPSPSAISSTTRLGAASPSSVKVSGASCSPTKG